VKNGEPERDICIIIVDNFNQKCVSEVPNKDERDFIWSPDGKFIAYRVSDLSVESGSTETHLYDLENEKTTVLPTDWFIYSWSPDGTRFVTTDYYDKRGFGEIVIVNLTDYHIDRLTNNDVADRNPAWSPDGTQIAYISGYPDSGLMVMNTDGSNQKRLTTPTMKVNDEVQLTWSPDGKEIAFVVNGDFIGQDQTSEIYIVNADGNNLHQLMKTGGVNLNPQWSPDGTQMVFYGYAVGAFDDVSSTTSLRTEVFRINADGSDLTDLTQSTGLDYQPTWSPDGQWIAFASTRESPGIFIMRPDGTDIHMVTHEPPFSEGGREANNPVWRPEPVKP
jgi:Tol biopolymer transport system component